MPDGRQLEDEVRRIAEPILAEQGLELVELSLRGSGGGRVLRLDVDRAGARGIDVADCQRVSQRLGQALDEADAIADRYLLEVSSPGIERPIRSADDIRRNTGRRVAVTCCGVDGGERSVSGILRGQDDESLVLETADGARVRIPLAEVRHARQEVGF